MAFQQRPSIHRVPEFDNDIADDSLIEIFLPSYADYHFDDLERKQDPVEDIVVTDEEIANMFPS